MSRSLKVHERKDTVKWVLVALALLLVGAILCGLMTDWFREWNPFCWFGHKYGDDGKCTRCGAEKPAEEPKPEPQAFVAEPMTFRASANMLASGGVAAQADIPSGYQRLAVGDAYESVYVDLSFAVNDGQQFFDQGTFYSVKLFTLTNGQSVYLTTYFHNENLFAFGWNDYTGVDTRDDSEVNLWFNAVNSLYLLVELDYYFQSTGFIQSIETEYANYLYTELVQYELPDAPSKPGYTFTGWYTDEACTNKYTEDYVTGDITLYAGFQAHTYSIKFNANSGSGTMDNLPMTYDTAKALTANGFTKEHYSFNGWATSADGDVVYANNAEVNNLTTEDNATVELFAVWERSEVCVSFVSESNTVATTWIAIGTKATLPETPVKEGHLFNGWYYEDGSKYTEQNISEDITLTAKFDIIRCTVTFMVDGQVYAVYVCDWGTSIAQALNGAGVNTVLYKADKQSGNF